MLELKPVRPCESSESRETPVDAMLLTSSISSYLAACPIIEQRRQVNSPLPTIKILIIQHKDDILDKLNHKQKDIVGVKQ